MSRIRNLAICVFRHGSRILVARGLDEVTGHRFLRPLGGAIEFGESSEEALRREILEEVGLEIEGLARLGVIENRFVYRGRPRHEIVFVFDASFVDRRVYGTAIPFREAGWTGPAEWIDLAVPLPLPLYPAGLDTLRRAG